MISGTELRTLHMIPSVLWGSFPHLWRPWVGEPDLEAFGVFCSFSVMLSFPHVRSVVGEMATWETWEAGGLALMSSTIVTAENTVQEQCHLVS
jgi:hypothetical protein